MITLNTNKILTSLPLNTDPKTFAFVKMNEDVSSKEDRRVVIKELKEKLKADEVPEEFAVVCQYCLILATCI